MGCANGDQPRPNGIRERDIKERISVVMSADAVDMAMLQFFRRGFADADHLDIKMQGLIGERMIAVEGHHVAGDARSP